MKWHEQKLIDYSELAKCTICLKIIGRIITAYDGFELECDECAQEEFDIAKKEEEREINGYIEACTKSKKQMKYDKSEDGI